MTFQKLLVSRNDLRSMGLSFSNTHYGRLEEQGLLTPIKVGNFRSARVHYRLDEALKLIDKSVRKPKGKSND